MEKISVFGASGFIGSSLVKSLCNQNVLINTISQSSEIPGVIPTSHLRNFKLNLENAQAWPDEIFDVDTIYYLISPTTPSSGQKNLLEDISLNLKEGVRLFERIKNPKTHLIFASSGGTIYGSTDDRPAIESHPTNPICGYGIIKLTLEKYIQMITREGRFKSSILRIANPYGPWNFSKVPFGVINVFINNLATSKPITLMGARTSQRDYIYINDLVEILNLVRNNPNAENDLFNVGTGNGTTLLDIISQLQRIHDFEFTEVASRSFDLAHNILDISKIKSKLGWTPKTKLEEGIAATYQWRITQDKAPRG